jgi:hypothetical protein
LLITGAASLFGRRIFGLLAARLLPSGTHL